MPATSLSSSLTYPIQDLDFFSSFDRKFSRMDPAIQSILPHLPRPASFKAALQAKQMSYIHRKRLASILDNQYSGFDLPAPLARNLQDLSRGEAYCITTAHQPLLFGGTLYFLFKALSTIRLAREAESWLSGQRVVPVFVLGSEDHDYEEVRHIQLGGKPVSWESDPHGGPVGRMGQGNIPSLIEQIKAQFAPLPFGQEVITLLEASYLPGESFSRSTFRFLHQLLGKYGLVVVDFDHPIAKESCMPIFEKELTHGFSKPIIEQTVLHLNEAGIEQQAHVRDINLFYLADNRRERIETTSDGRFKTVDNLQSWTKEEICQELHQHPDRFSPNVNLRPLLQETMLPNLAFVGGAGELAYWVQLTDLFKELKVPYPVLVRRHSGLLVDEWTQQKLTRLGLSLESFFQPMEDLLQQYVKDATLMPSDLNDERQALQALMIQVKSKCQAIDPTLERSAESAEVQIDKLLQALETKMTRGLKQLHEREVSQIRGVYDRMMPEGKLQERNENFLFWMARYGTRWIDDMMDKFKPLESTMVCYLF